MDVYLLVFGIVVPWLLVGLGCWIGLQLIRQNGRILVQLEVLERHVGALEEQLSPAYPSEPEPEGLPVGSAAPEFELPDLQGARHSLSEWLGKSVVVAFFNPACGFCREMAADLATLGADTNGRAVPLIVTTGGRKANEDLVAEHGLETTILLQEDGEVAERYEAYGTPTGYLIDAEGRVASELAVGSEALLALMDGESDPYEGNGDGRSGGLATRSVADSRIKRDGLEARTPAPEFTLPQVGGGELSLSDYRGRRVLLVFSDPDCGPCNALGSELEELHRHTSDPSVLVVSRGGEDVNRAKAEEEKLTYPVVLQRRWEISKEYAIFATPVGYLIDEQGVISEDVAVGADDILALTEMSGARRGSG